MRFQSEVLDGFERDHSRLVRHDDLRYRVVWNSDGATRTIGQAPADRPIIIRFVLGKGKLFAFEVN